MQVVTQLQLHRIVSKHVSATKVCLPGLEDRSKVNKEDVVSLDSAIRKTFFVGLEGIRTASHHPLVPMAFNAKAGSPKFVDFVAYLFLANAWVYQIALDLIEQSLGFILGVEKSRGFVLVCGDRVCVACHSRMIEAS